MTKFLSAKQKATELGISTRSLAQSRHFYAHRKVSDRKYLYLEEEAKDYNRPILDPLSDKRRSMVKRRDVHPGDTRYHLCPGGSGEKFKLLNQMRAKASLEGKVKPEDLKYLSGAMAIKIKDNAKQIVEQEQVKKRSALLAEEERARKRDPSRYGGMIRGVRNGIVDVRTPWKNLFETPKTEYDVALEDAEDTPGKKYYW